VFAARSPEPHQGTGDQVLKLRCILDGLLLPATLPPEHRELTAYDGDEGFAMEAVEAIYYELVSATPDELLRLERAHYRLLRRAEDFRTVRME
jgi:hypothetical protein